MADRIVSPMRPSESGLDHRQDVDQQRAGAATAIVTDGLRAAVNAGPINAAAHGRGPSDGTRAGGHGPDASGVCPNRIPFHGRILIQRNESGGGCCCGNGRRYCQAHFSANCLAAVIVGMNKISGT